MMRRFVDQNGKFWKDVSTYILMVSPYAVVASSWKLTATAVGVVHADVEADGAFAVPVLVTEDIFTAGLEVGEDPERPYQSLLNVSLGQDAAGQSRNLPVIAMHRPLPESCVSGKKTLGSPAAIATAKFPLPSVVETVQPMTSTTLWPAINPVSLAANVSV
jgi:hypothetical protein